MRLELSKLSPKFLNAPVTLWIVLSLPALYWLYAYRQDVIFYGELLHASGVLAARLLIIAMAVTSLGLMFPGAGWVRWLRRRRRYIGVAAFGYTLLHAAVYVQRRPELAFLVEEAGDAGMWTGWLALMIMLCLAITSNNASVRLLGQAWKRLHRLVYPAAVLAFMHWVLTAFDPGPAYAHIGVLAGLEAYRLWKTGIEKK